jgi:hypothetical protein
MVQRMADSSKFEHALHALGLNYGHGHDSSHYASSNIGVVSLHIPGSLTSEVYGIILIQQQMEPSCSAIVVLDPEQVPNFSSDCNVSTISSGTAFLTLSHNGVLLSATDVR